VARYFDEGHHGAGAYYTEAARAVAQIDTWRGGERVAPPALTGPGGLVVVRRLQPSGLIDQEILVPSDDRAAGHPSF